MSGEQRVNQHLGRVIQDLIKCNLNLNYCGNIEVRDIIYCECGDPCDDCDTVVGYELRLGTPKLPHFVSIVRYGDEQTFIDFCLKEIKSRHLEAIKHYSVKLIYANEKEQ